MEASASRTTAPPMPRQVVDRSGVMVWLLRHGLGVDMPRAQVQLVLRGLLTPAERADRGACERRQAVAWMPSARGCVDFKLALTKQ